MIGQRFVVPHFSQTPPNHWPENLRSRELPTGSKDVDDLARELIALPELHLLAPEVLGSSASYGLMQLPRV